MFTNIQDIASTKLREDALSIIEAGVSAVLPSTLFSEKVRFQNNTLIVDDQSMKCAGRVFVIGAGKAAGAMAKELEAIVGVERIVRGIVTCTTSSSDTSAIEVVEAGHPYPDKRGVDAVGRMLALRDEMQEGDAVICLLSGGGSSLLAHPAGKISLKDESWIIEQCMINGVPADEMNTIRTHLSSVKGGKLAEHFHPFSVMSIVISNLVGDQNIYVAGGPSVESPTSAVQAHELLLKYGINIPSSVAEQLKRGIEYGGDTTRIDNATTVVLADVTTALNAMNEKSEVLGYKSMILSKDQKGITEDVAGELSRDVARRRYKGINSFLVGGRTRENLPEAQKGYSRVLSYALHSLEILSSLPGEWLLASIKTDGFDAFGNMGVLVDNTTPRIHIQHFIDTYTPYTYFESIGNCLLQTGATHTDVGDIQLYLIK